MFYKLIYSDTLSHHGILGMKWGKRNGPPYPLDAEDHSASERKAGWEKSLGKKIKEKRAENLKIKEEKKARKELRNNVINRSIEIDNDFDKTKVGSAKREAYLKAIQDLESRLYGKYSDEENESFYKQFYEVERDYLTSQGEYTAKKLLNEFSLTQLQDAEKAGFVINTKLVNAKTLEEYIKEYGKQAAYLHAL